MRTALARWRTCAKPKNCCILRWLICPTFDGRSPSKKMPSASCWGTIPVRSIAVCLSTSKPHPLDVPIGVPSQLLERRPDIQQAEAKLVAANARVGVARAQYFPQISLTSMGGAASSQLNSIFSSPNTYWYAAGSVSQPIFEGGRIRSNYRLSKAQQQEMLLEYQKAILGALKDVSNSLVSYKETRERREEQFEHVKSASDAVRLARLRYSGGNASYLEVLTTDTDLYSAQLLLAQAQQEEAASLVQLYTALGGGWQ